MSAKSELVTSVGPAKTRRTPIRTCVACRTPGGKRGLLRVVRLGAGDHAGDVVLDPTGKKSGRGAYVCPTAECIGLALKQKKLERSLKTPIAESVADTLRAAVVGTVETTNAALRVPIPSAEESGS
ncbi:MAG: YlxR family protein [Armatimonadota bacterium]